MSEPPAAPWRAPRASGPVVGTVRLPGSKSLTNRALVLAALADGPSVISRPLRARDTLLMAAALRTLGTEINDRDGHWQVTPGRLRAGEIDCGLAGTVMRFVPPLAALAEGDVRFDGDPRARERPMATLVDGLRQLGAAVDGDRLPFTVRGRGSVPGGTVRIDASASSQFVSGLLLSAPRYMHGIELRHQGARAVPSLPHLDMTLAMLRAARVAVTKPAPDVWQVAPGPIATRDVDIEPDLSNAAPFLAAAVATGGSVSVPDWPLDSTQPGAALPELLTRMGASVSRDGRTLTVEGGAIVSGLEADLRDVSELAPVLVALAALAESPSHLTGLAHMRGHETDRLAALTAELSRLGGDVREEPDGLLIGPVRLHGGLWHAYADHRMATAGAVLALVVDGVQVDDIATTSKTLPDFPAQWAALLG